MELGTDYNNLAMVSKWDKVANETDKKDTVAQQRQKDKHLFNFRFDLDISFPKDGDYRVLKLLECASDIIERNDSLSMSILVPSSNTGSVLSELLMKCSEVRSITVNHRDDDDNCTLATKYTLEKFLGWEIVSEAFGEKYLTLKLSWLSTPSMVVEQSKEGLEEWLKKGENTTNE